MLVQPEQDKPKWKSVGNRLQRGVRADLTRSPGYHKDASLAWNKTGKSLKSFQQRFKRI